MKIYTSYFAQAQRLVSADILLIGISRYPARFLPKSTVTVYLRELAPLPSFMKEAQEIYTPAFKTMLGKLCPDEILGRIQKISMENGDKDVALVCFERPEDFCHRHLVAEWLEVETGEKIEEWTEKGAKRQLSLF